MAQLIIKDLEKLEKERHNVHSPVQGGYYIFEEGPKRYFQIDMFGSESRKFKRKVSQVLQLDQENVRELVKLFKKLGFI